MKNQIDHTLLESVMSGLPPCQLSQTRSTAFKYFKENPLPSTKNEQWKYTDLNNAYSLFEQSLQSEKHFSDIDQGGEQDIINSIEAHWIVIKNNSLVTKNQNLQGLTITSLSENLDATEILTDDTLTSLNAVMMSDAIKVKITKNNHINKPIGILFDYGTNIDIQSSSPRCIIEVEDGASIKLIHAHTAKVNTPHVINSVIQVNLGKKANAEFVKVQNYSTNQTLIEKTKINLSAEAFLNYSSVELGGQLSRTDIIINFNGKSSTALINGAYIAGNNQHIDNHILANHAHAMTHSSQNFYGVIGNKGCAVFNGKALVHEGAFDTNANQYNHNLLLSENAEINTKPELEIYTDDVKCSHGTTVGQLDEDAIFYLRSRGISKELAKQLLTKTFITRILADINIPNVKEYIESLIELKLKELS